MRVSQGHQFCNGHRGEALAAVVVVAGLAIEARIAAAKHARALSGGDGRTLATSLGFAVASDCRGIISFGIAGGLSPGVRTGTCLVATSIVSGTTRFITDGSWSRSLLELIPGAAPGLIAGVPPPFIASPEDKRALHLRTSALAVDNESHVVASVAASRGLPVAAVRVVTDTVDRALPRCAWDAMRADGTIDFVAFMRSVARNPADIPLLMKTAFDAIAGFATLLRCRPMLGPGLGLPSLRMPARPSAELSRPAFCRLEEPYGERP